MRFFDNAWDYNEGRREEYMGQALSTGGRRQKVFLMTKVCARDYNGAKQQLDESLRRLKTDVIDLVQFHEINWDIDKPIAGQELDELLAKTAQPGRDGKLEPHKTTRYGSAYHFRQHEA